MEHRHLSGQGGAKHRYETSNVETYVLFILLKGHIFPGDGDTHL